MDTSLANEVDSTAAPAASPTAAPKSRAYPPPPADKQEEYRKRVVGTNIDTRSLLSTDYFNSFNSVVMMLDMLPDAPELLEEIEQWHFIDYIEHFRSSGLDFASLAIEAYAFSPPELRESLESKTNAIRIVIEDTTHTLRTLLAADEKDVFSNIARTSAAQLRTMIEEGNGIVHGTATPSQSEIDKLF